MIPTLADVIDPTPGRLRVATRFLKGIVPGPGECLDWAGTRKREAYGRMRVNGRNDGVHRVSYELFIGSIPAGLVIDHGCRRHCCVNPDHLEPVTNYVNVIVRSNLGPGRLAKLTHCKNGHEFTPENTHFNPSGWRVCRTCQRALWATPEYKAIQHQRYLARRKRQKERTIE